MKFDWPYLKSFFIEKVIERSSSPHNEILEVWYVSGKKVLNSKSVNFSFGELDKVFRSAFSQLPLSERHIQKTLLLGLGVGNVPAILEEISPGMKIVGVEIDAEVVRLGRNHFDLDHYTNVEVVIEDAVEYVANCSDQFQLIIVDLFVDALVPKGAEQEDFLLKIADLLEPGGLLLFNRLMHSPALRQQSEDFTRKMMAVLPGTQFIKAHKNRMLYYEKLN